MCDSQPENWLNQLLGCCSGFRVGQKLERGTNNMPSLNARIVGFVLRTTGIYRRMYRGGPAFAKNIAKAKAARQSEPVVKPGDGLDLSGADYQGRTVWRIAPKDDAPVATLLYWHGGGYVYPPTPVHWAFLVAMAKAERWEIIAPCYPLAPEAEAREVTDFALSFYRDLLTKTDETRLIMGGDSAGGGLTAATVQLARDAGIALPKALLLICPWLDLVPSQADQAKIEPRDGILTLSGITEAGALYGREIGVDDPRAGPIHGSFAGLPPTLAFGGGDDILVTDARRLKQVCPEVDYHEEAGLIHDWPIFTFPESRAAQKQMGEFVRQHV
jgi:epsilon-lactone hydrolase